MAAANSTSQGRFPMLAKYSAAEIFKVIKGRELSQEKIDAIEKASLDSPTVVVAGAGSG